MQGLTNQAKAFLSEDFNRFALLLVLIAAAYSLVFSAVPQPIAPQQFFGNTTLTIDFFYHPACPHCKAQMPENQKLSEEFPQAGWKYHDVSVEKENALLESKLFALGKNKTGVPTTIINRTVVVGFNEKETPQLLHNAIAAELSLSGAANATSPPSQKPSLPFIGTIDPSSYSLPALALILGLIDGFNPCAMWVLLYLISITLTLNDRRRFLLVVGTFLFASGALYFLIMTAWLNAFLFVGYLRPVMIAVGAIALFWSMQCMREFVKNKGNMSCTLGDVKEKRKMKKGMDGLLSSPLTIATFAGIVMLAFTVNSIEFVCSSAIPAVFTNVLALHNLPAIEYYFYISIYIVMYMLDDIIVFALAYFAMGGSLGDKIASWGHIIGAIILFILGIMLLFFPSLLMA